MGRKKDTESSGINCKDCVDLLFKERAEEGFPVDGATVIACIV